MAIHENDVELLLFDEPLYSCRSPSDI